MNLYNEIMNIRCDPNKVPDRFEQRDGYKVGHRDARHAAAELSTKYENEIEELKSELVRVATIILSAESNPNIDELAHELLGKYK